MTIREPLLAACCLCALALAIRSSADDNVPPARADAPASAPAARPAAPGAPGAAGPDAAAIAAAAASGATTIDTANGSGPIPVRHVVDTGQTAGGPGEPAYSITASWVIAGYNDNEIIYSILITNQDPHIIRCNTLLHGFYIDNGVKRAISDRQGVTIFPGKQQNAGTWVGMDQASGATYKVTCRSLS